jgi:epoxyqueuosine reductase
MSLTTDIKEYALSLGFARVGITTMEDFTDFENELSSRGSLYDHWRERFRAGSRPRRMFDAGKSIIVLAYDYAQCAFPARLASMVARVYLSRCYLPPPDTVAGTRIRLFEDFLSKNNCRFIDDKNTIILRRAAARAGIATFGRNNFAYVDGIGSFVILYGFIVDRELVYDSPTMENKCPANCRRCIDACPTKAIYEPFKLNPPRCIGFNNWMRREDKGILHTTVPIDIRKGIGIHIHGCDVCQEVCPRNARKIKNAYPPDPFLEMLNDKITLSDTLKMSDHYYDHYIHPVMYNYIRHKKLFQRNVAIAMGNTKDERFLADLGPQLRNPEETVRIHVAWALGNIGGNRSKQLLENHQAAERSEQVRQEISLALSGMG